MRQPTTARAGPRRRVLGGRSVRLAGTVACGGGRTPRRVRIRVLRGRDPARRPTCPECGNVRKPRIIRALFIARERTTPGLGLNKLI
eukprot:2937598-Prymnesium_polylepis.1